MAKTTITPVVASAIATAIAEATTALIEKLEEQKKELNSLKEEVESLKLNMKTPTATVGTETSVDGTVTRVGTRAASADEHRRFAAAPAAENTTPAAQTETRPEDRVRQCLKEFMTQVDYFLENRKGWNQTQFKAGRLLLAAGWTGQLPQDRVYAVVENIDELLVRAMPTSHEELRNKARQKFYGKMAQLDDCENRGN